MPQNEQAGMEAAIKALELSLHPNTPEQELLAGVRGFRAKAKGRPLSEIAQFLYGGRYDGRTLPEYREEWQRKIDGQTIEIHTLKAEITRLSRSETQLKLLLQKAVAEQRTAVDARLRAETKLAEATKSAKTAMAMVRTASRVKPTPETPIREPRGPCPAPVFMKKPTDIKPGKGAAWTMEHREFLISLYKENPEYSNKYLRDRLNERFNTTRTENAIRGELNRLRDKGLTSRYRPGHERQKAA